MGANTTTAWVRTSVEPDAVHVRVGGRLGTRTVADVRGAFHAAIDGADRAILIDLAEVEVTDATGLGLIIECYRRAHRRALPVHIVALSDRTRRLLRGIRMDRVLLSA